MLKGVLLLLLIFSGLAIAGKAATYNDQRLAFHNKADYLLIKHGLCTERMNAEKEIIYYRATPKMDFMFHLMASEIKISSQILQICYISTTAKTANLFKWLIPHIMKNTKS